MTSTKHVYEVRQKTVRFDAEVESNASTESINLKSIPNDGLKAWIQCACAFFLFFNSWGIVVTFGAYQTYYKRDLLPHRSPSDISWIGSIQAGLLMFVGLLSGPLYDHGYLRTLVWTGSFLVTLGTLLTSLSTQYWQLVLAQGLMIGVGSGCLFVPSVAFLPSYFTAKRALAMGIAASGSNVAGILYPIVFHRLQPMIGFGWATRVVAFIMMATLMFPILCVRTRETPSTNRRFFDTSAWRETPYVLFAFSSFFGFLALYIPFFYIQLYSIEHDIIMPDLGFYLLPLVNVGTFLGRLLLSYLADKAGPLNTLATCLLIATAMAFTWLAVHNVAGIITFSILYGFFAGSFLSLAGNVVATTLCPHMGVVGVRIGMMAIPNAVGLLIGNPLAGAVLRRGWTPLQVFCGAVVGVSAFCAVAARFAKVGKGGRSKC